MDLIFLGSNISTTFLGEDTLYGLTIATLYIFENPVLKSQALIWR